MKKYSSNWNSSKQKRKQRKYRFNAPLHKRQKLISVHLNKELKKQYKKRSIQPRKGDEVKIMRGEQKGRTGKISRVDMKKLKLYLENIKVKKVSGQELQFPIDPSNVMLTKMNLDDPRRIKFVERKAKVKKGV